MNIRNTIDVFFKNGESYMHDIRLIDLVRIGPPLCTIFHPVLSQVLSEPRYDEISVFGINA